MGDSLINRAALKLGDTSLGVDIKITKVVWRNYRRLVDGAIDVRRHAVLVGPIASGKSSVLRAIAMCLGSGPELGSITIRDFTDASQPLMVEVVLGELDDDDRAAFPDEIDVTDGDTVTVRVKATVDPADPDATLMAERTFRSRATLVDRARPRCSASDLPSSRRDVRSAANSRAPKVLPVAS